MEEILIEVIREQRAAEVILSELGRQTGRRSIFKLMSFMTCTTDQKLFGLYNSQREWYVEGMYSDGRKWSGMRYFEGETWGKEATRKTEA